MYQGLSAARHTLLGSVPGQLVRSSILFLQARPLPTAQSNRQRPCAPKGQPRSPWWWTPPGRARCAWRSGCRARRRRSRLRGTRRRASSGSTTLRSPHDRRRARQGTDLRERRPHVRPLTQPASGGARRLAGPHLGGTSTSRGSTPKPPLECPCRCRNGATVAPPRLKRATKIDPRALPRPRRVAHRRGDPRAQDHLSG